MYMHMCVCVCVCVCVLQKIYICNAVLFNMSMYFYSFGRCFNPKWLTVEENNEQFIIIW